jgi:hypothetical protein
MAYCWFLGDNDLGLSMANPTTGGCFDGLSASGANQNQGGESTLMWLTALEVMRELRRSTRHGQGRARPVATSTTLGARA